MVEFLQKNRQAVTNMECLRTALARSYDEYLEDVRSEGRMEGMEQGKLESALEIARKMLDSNVPLKDIASFSGLSFDTIQSLAS